MPPDEQTGGAPDTSAGEGKNTGAATGQAPDPASGVVTSTAFTQADVDRIVTERLAEEKERERKRAEGERQKAQAEALKAAGDWQKVAEQREAEAAQYRAELHRQRAVLAATKANALYPDVVADRLPAEALEGDEKALERALTQIRQQYPALFRDATTVAGSADGGVGNGHTTSGDPGFGLNRLRDAYSHSAARRR